MRLGLLFAPTRESVIIENSNQRKMLEQARRAPQTVTADWIPVAQQKIAGVQIKEMKNVVIRAGVLTECFRPEWFDPPFHAAHVVYMALTPGGISSWHCHGSQTDVIVPV